jgi:hypothetical protein
MTTHFLLVVISLKFFKASFPLFEENEPESHVSIQVVCAGLEYVVKPDLSDLLSLFGNERRSITSLL